METRKRLVSIIVLIVLVILPAKAQEKRDSIPLYQVETMDGNIYNGTIISKDEQLLVLKTVNLGEIKIPVSTIKKIEELIPTQIKKGEVWFENPHGTRYFYLPNGYGLRKGEGYYQNAWVMFNQVSYGITNNFSLGAGLVPTFLFGDNGVPLWITPKFSFPIKKDKWNLGLGAIAFKYFTSSFNSPTVGIVYGVSTFGPSDKNFTVGAGYAFADGEFTSRPIVSFGGTYRTGKRHYLVTENYIFFGDGESLALIWFGGRFVSKHLAIDYGLITPAGPQVQQWVGIPWLSITVPFGNVQPLKN